MNKGNLFGLFAAVCLWATAACAAPLTRPIRQPLFESERGSPQSRGQGRPNFVVIFTDDQGYADLSCFGGTHVSTPRIDQMAAEGARLTSFYVAQPLCTPSRAALMTGCYPKRIDMAVGHDFPVLLAADTKGLNPDEITIAEVLKGAGYRTGMFGKWHLGDQPEFLPTRQGFEEFFGIPYSHDIHPYHTQQKKYQFPPLPLLEGERVVELDPDADYLTRRFTERSVQFIEENKDRPFLLYLAHPIPHRPLHASPPFMKDVSAAIKAKLAKEGDGIDYKTRDKIYKQAINEIDWSVGQILDVLKQQGIDDNTLVIFTSDNGPMIGKAAPLSGKKGKTLEGGMREPTVIRWPGKIPAAGANDEIMTAMDLLPTFARLAGVELPKDRVIDGKDIWPVLTGTAKSPHEAFFYHKGNKLEAVRSGKWKLHLALVQRAKANGASTAKPALFDLEADIGEKRNVYADHPDVVARLRGYVKAFEEELAQNSRPAAFVDNAKALTLAKNVASGMQAEQAVDAGLFKVMQVNEITFHAQKSYTNPYMEVDLWVDLNEPDGLSYRIPAFWDGGQVFRVRLVATKPGVWNWSTGADTGDPGLDNQNGSFKATDWTEAEKEANPNRRGFIRVASNNRTLEYADGTPFFHTGDTWWTALTQIFAWGTDDGVAGISFQDAIAKRKSQGFNGISMIACFPSDTLNSIWESGKLVRKVAEDGSTPFFVDTDQPWKTAPDYTRINPSYWQHADRKMQHLWDNGFVAQLESVRRHEEWYNESPAEKGAFTNYIRYMWARWGCYNVIFNWVHGDANNKQHVLYRPMVVQAAAELGKPPYGQPRAVMTPRSNLEMGWLDLEPSIVEIHSWSNYGRDGECITGLREMFNMEDFAPQMNLEPFYPGLVAGFNPRPANLNDTEAGQYIAYGCVLNGGALAGHVWGDVYYSGCAPASNRIKGDIPARDPQRNAFDKFNSASMGKLKDFMLDPGHDYRVLQPARDNLVDHDEEFQCLALAPDKSFGLGFIAANYTKTDIINLMPNAAYSLEWYNIDTGVWSSAVTVSTDGTGKLVMPGKPNTNGWAFRIKSKPKA